MVMLKYSSRPTIAMRNSTTHAPAVPRAPSSTALTPMPSTPPPSPRSIAVSPSASIPPPPPTRWNIPSSASANTAAPVAAIQRSAGIVFIHSITAKPASSGAANAIPHPSSEASRSCQGWTIAPAVGANSAMTLRMARNSRTSATPSRTNRPLMTNGVV